MSDLEVKRMIYYARKLWNNPQPGMEFCSMMTVLSDTKEGDDFRDAQARLAAKRLASFGTTKCTKCLDAKQEKEMISET